MPQPTPTAAPHLRVAHPTADLQEATRMYRDGLGLTLLGGFTDHDGFDGNMLGMPDAGWHLELTHQRAATSHVRPDGEALIVLYHPEAEAWEAACARIVAAGFTRVTANNPYWEQCARTFEDLDGYRVVLARQGWDPR